MDEVNSFIRKVFFFLIALYPWVNYFVRKLPSFGSISDDLLILLFTLFAIVIGRKKILNLLKVSTVLFAMLFVAVALFSFFFNTYLFLAFQHQLRLFVEPFFVFIDVYLVAPKKSDIEFYLKCLVFSTVLLALHGVYQYITKVPTPVQWVDKALEGNAIYTRAFSVVGSPNVLAGYLEIGLPVAIYYVFEHRDYIKKIFYGLVSIVIVAGLFLTFSRGGWIGAFGSLFVGFVAFSPLIGIALIAVAGLAVFLVPVLRVRVFSLIDPSYIDKSLNSGGRLFRWKYGLMNGFEHPLLGTGLGTFGGSAAQKYGYFSYTSMDSVYINVFAETGFLGIITFILWVSSSFANFAARFFKEKKTIFLFLGIALLALLIHIFVENLFNVWGITMNFWIISALSEVIDEW